MAELREWLCRGVSEPETSGESAEIVVLCAAGVPCNRLLDGALFGLPKRELAAVTPQVAAVARALWRTAELSFVPLMGHGALAGKRLGIVTTAQPDTCVAAAKLLGLAPKVWGVERTGTAFELGVRLLQCEEIEIAVVLEVNAFQASACWLALEGTAKQEGWRRTSKVQVLQQGGVQGSSLTELADSLNTHQTSEILLNGCRLALTACTELEESTCSPRFLGLSAHSLQSLNELCVGAAGQIKEEGDLIKIARSAVRRVAFPFRASVHLDDWNRAREDLLAPAREGRRVQGLALPGKTCFLFPPSGGKIHRAGLELFDAEPAFRDAMLQVDKWTRPGLPKSIMAIWDAPEGREGMSQDPGFSNPLTFALSWALTAAYKQYGVVPDVVAGTGVGELVAAAVAGAMSPEHAARLAVLRGRLVRSVERPGKRATIDTTESRIRELLEEHPNVDLVGVPLPMRCVVGGESADVDAFLRFVRRQGERYERNPIYPAHSRCMEPTKEKWMSAVAQFSSHEPTTTWWSMSTVKRQLEAPSAEFWWQTLRGTFRFSSTIEALYDSGVRRFVEIGGRPMQAPAGVVSLDSRQAAFLAGLEGPNEPAHLSNVLGALWVNGAAVDRGDGAYCGEPQLINTPVKEPPVELKASAPQAKELQPIERPETEVQTKESSIEDAPTERQDPQPASKQRRMGPLAPRIAFWEDAELPEHEIEPRRWLLLMDQGGIAEMVARKLETKGHKVVRLTRGGRAPKGGFACKEPLADRAFCEVLDHLEQEDLPVSVVHFWALDLEDDDTDEKICEMSWGSMLRLSRGIAVRKLNMPITAVCYHGDGRVEPSRLKASGGLTGAAQVLDHVWLPGISGVVRIDFDDPAIDLMIQHLLADEGEALVSVNANGRRARRYKVSPLVARGKLAKAWLVHGPIDARLVAIARWLADHGAKKIFLVGPNAPGGGVLHEILALQRRGVVCIVQRLDLTQDNASKELQSRIGKEPSLGCIAVIGTHPQSVWRQEPATALAIVRRAVCTVTQLEAVATKHPWIWIDGGAPSAVGTASAIVGGLLAANVETGQQKLALVLGPDEMVDGVKVASVLGGLGLSGFGVLRISES